MTQVQFDKATDEPFNRLPFIKAKNNFLYTEFQHGLVVII